MAGQIVSGSDDIVINPNDFQMITSTEEILRNKKDEINEIENLESTNLSIVSASRLSIFDGRPSMDEEIVNNGETAEDKTAGIGSHRSQLQGGNVPAIVKQIELNQK